MRPIPALGRALTVFFTACGFAATALVYPQAQAPAVQASVGSEQSSKIWLDRTKEFEEYLKTAEIVKVDDLSVGVTKPKRAELAPGGPVSALAWKQIKPGRYQGYWESYKSEIAAYELDKHLGLNMVPPTVEKRYKGELGAAVMWCPSVKSFKDLGGVPNPPPVHLAKWNKQLIRAKMFDNLIYNVDPNLGNWLVDPAWNLILIDHTRSFTSGTKMAHEMTRVDAELWERMLALTEASLKPVLGEWLRDGEIRDIIKRRDKMAEIVDQLVKKNGEAAVIVR
jgi:hypothetical protein